MQHRIAVLALAAFLLATGVSVVATPTATASACNPDFPGSEITCAVYDDVNNLCRRVLGGTCFE